ncbi:hypothetical protein CC1G_08272 [Coprinopsis cinerea okayama7|uniref:Uncharacterized protein n=1 Tax=Coprinopsis cinerea (strain Okayama-7 / 130 / ATCC MYA-4618 / FGSC 9003) TaxID=240176 RepID=A8PG26_COPC7|nr:hypothetical protein CC1G_08272 [Coprinopsis cinerea okayama7\|eukprot:XP_001841128.2 hypothetical protein CC1G_08272 [Coprinopsis cinerea okayama7\
MAQANSTAASTEMDSLLVNDPQMEGEITGCEGCKDSLSASAMPSCHAPTYPDMVLYPPLPPDYTSLPCHLVYAFPVTRDVLRSSMRKLGFKASKRVIVSETLASFGWILEAKLDYKYNLVYCPALPDEQAEEDDMVSEWEGNPAVHTLALAATASHKLFHQRPTPEQWQKLEGIFEGSKPRWFQTHWPKDRFPQWLWEDLPKMSPALYDITFGGTAGTKKGHS